MMLMKTFARLKFDKNVLQMLPLNALQVPKTSTETSGVQVVTEKHHEFRNSHVNRREPIICLKAFHSVPSVYSLSPLDGTWNEKRPTLCDIYMCGLLIGRINLLKVM